MKINVKPKIEPTAQFNIRLPLSLKQRLDELRTRAAEYSADFNATLVAVLEEFPMEDKERRIVSFQVSGDEVEAIERAAASQGVSRSEYLRSRVLSATNE